MPMTDPLTSLNALLPLADTVSGGQLALAYQPGAIRPFSATLAVAPIVHGKHHTTDTRSEVTKETQYTDDSETKSDSVTQTQVDS